MRVALYIGVFIGGIDRSTSKMVMFRIIYMRRFVSRVDRCTHRKTSSGGRLIGFGNSSIVCDKCFPQIDGRRSTKSPVMHGEPTSLPERWDTDGLLSKKGDSSTACGIVDHNKCRRPASLWTGESSRFVIFSLAINYVVFVLET